MFPCFLAWRFRFVYYAPFPRSIPTFHGLRFSFVPTLHSYVPWLEVLILCISCVYLPPCMRFSFVYFMACLTISFLTRHCCPGLVRVPRCWEFRLYCPFRSPCVEERIPHPGSHSCVRWIPAQALVCTCSCAFLGVRVLFVRMFAFPDVEVFAGALALM